MKKHTKKREYHGDTGNRLLRIYRLMIDRCTNQNATKYYCYGARGITICSEWRESYVSFRDWALHNGYADNLSIERIDVNKGYYPENCTWIKMSEQAKNRRPVGEWRSSGAPKKLNVVDRLVVATLSRMKLNRDAIASRFKISSKTVTDVRKEVFGE